MSSTRGEQGRRSERDTEVSLPHNLRPVSTSLAPADRTVVRWARPRALALVCTLAAVPSCAQRQSPPLAIPEIRVEDRAPPPAPGAARALERVTLPPPYEVPAEARRRADVPAGRVLPGRYTSRSYRRAFDYWLYVPAQYRRGQRAALMVFQDGGKHYLGHDLRSGFHADVVLDNLIAEGVVPVTLALFVDPTTQRSQEYDRVDDAYGRFLIDELVRDVVTRHYDVTDDPEGWAIGGFSSGGVAAFTVAWHFPDRFRRVLTHNGSFTAIARVRLQQERAGDDYPALVRQSPRKPLRVMLLSGTRDIDDPRVGSWLRANQQMADALEAAGYPVRFVSGDGEHYPPAQAAADFPDALRWLWRGYSPRP